VSFTKNLAKCGDFLFRKRKVMVFGKFEYQSGGFMLLTRSNVSSNLDLALQIITGTQTSVATTK
jgi:hypothetical protein